jgi:hypothetical protein
LPITYHCDPERRLVICEAEGELTGEDLMDFDRRLREDPEITADLDQLFDLSRARGTEVSSADIRELVAPDPVFGPSSHRAFIGKSRLAFGMMRMFALYREEKSGTFRFFRDRGEAERWLAEGRIPDAKKNSDG